MCVYKAICDALLFCSLCKIGLLGVQICAQAGHDCHLCLRTRIANAAAINIFDYHIAFTMCQSLVVLVLVVVVVPNQERLEVAAFRRCFARMLGALLEHWWRAIPTYSELGPA